MLLDGELDAVIGARLPSRSAVVPQCSRLPNYRHVEQDYFRKTGIFPIMHSSSCGRMLYRDKPWIAESLSRLRRPRATRLGGDARRRQYAADAALAGADVEELRPCAAETRGGRVCRAKPSRS